MRFSTWLRGTAAAVGTVMIVASGAAPALAASAEQSIVQMSALDGQWTLLSKGADATEPLDNYSVTFSSGDSSATSTVAMVSLVVMPSPDKAQAAVQALVDAVKADPAVAVVPSDTYGDTSGFEFTQSDPKNFVQGRLFVDKGTVVKIYVAGPLDQVDAVKATVDTLASALDFLLPSSL